MLARGEASAERVTEVFLGRIATLDDAGPAFNAIIEVNPDALAIARELDRRFAASGAVGPLHGVPVVLKASIDTADRMATSAGSLALARHYARHDAPLVARLRAAGAVLLAKANLSEWANFRSFGSTSGWSSLGGQTRNAYALDRSPCGSSSGSAVAVAARLAPLAVGTETDGSIACPAAVNGVVGVKPTHGLVSTEGIVPVAASQDTAGPLARTAADARLLLETLADPVALARQAPAAPLASFAGLRLGVVRDYAGAGSDAEVDAAYQAWLERLRSAGVELVDPVAGLADGETRAAELEVLLYEFKDGIDRYLSTVTAGPRSLAELIRFNDEHAAEVMPHFGQDIFLAAQRKGPLTDNAYVRALNASRYRLRARLAEAFDRHRLDALVAPANGPAWPIDYTAGDAVTVASSYLAAVSGFPSIVVPATLVRGLPVAFAFVGKPNADMRLLEIAVLFERLRGEFPLPPHVQSTAGSP